MNELMKREALIDAQYHAETLCDALELFRGSELHIAAPMLPMMADRLDALVYLIQFALTGFKPENYVQVTEAARAHDAK